MRDRENVTGESPDVSRRRALKTLGIAGAALAVSPGVAASRSGRGRTMRPDTAGIDALDDVTVTVTEDANVRVDMSGTRRPGLSGSKGYRVRLQNVRADDGRPTPRRAEATVVPLAEADLPDRRDDARTETSSPESVTDTATQADGVGTASHGGGDGESDYEGGAWARTEDPIDITVTKTNHNIEW